jgi:radical SAM superfamily enzyme YgiQ (UPF0313 family)
MQRWYIFCGIINMMRLTRWMFLSRVVEMIKVAKSLRRNMELINHFTYRTTNAMLDVANSVISLVKIRPRVFTMNHFRDMIFSKNTGLDLPYITFV